MIKTEIIEKFDYLSNDEVTDIKKDCWYRPENKLFAPLGDAINCINGLECGKAVYHPYTRDDTEALHIVVGITDEAIVGRALKIISRAMDRRYAGVVDWVCDIQHTDTKPHYILWISSGLGSKNKKLNEIVAESNRISANIMRLLDSTKQLDYFEKEDDTCGVGVSNVVDYGHVNSEMFGEIKEIQKRKKTLNVVLDS